MDGINYELDFEEHMDKKGDRELLEFVARQVLGQSQSIKKIAKEVKQTQTRSIINRYALVTLIIILITVGILDPSIFRLIP